MEVRHLRYFKTVAEKLSFTRAAEALHISQPPLTRQIRDLEAELGKTLFHRNTARVELTEAGLFFLREVSAILERLDDARAAVSELDGRPASVLRIGYMSSIPADAVASVIAGLKLRFPFLRASLYEVPSIRQIRALEAGRLDVGILRVPAESSGLRLETIFRDRFSLVFPASDEADLRHLAARDFIAFNRRHARYYHQQLLGCCSYLGFEPRITFECNHIQAILGMVEKNLGITILPSIVERAYGHLRLRFRPLSGLPLFTEIAVASPPSQPHPALESFIGLLRAQLVAPDTGGLFAGAEASAAK